MPQTHLETGDYDRAEELLQGLLGELSENPVNPTFHYSAAVMVAGLSSWLSDSPREPALPVVFSDVVLSSPFRIPLFASVTNIGLAFEALARGDRDDCSRAYEALAHCSGRYLSVVAVDRLLGQLALAVGSVPRSIEHFEDSMTFCGKAGYRPEYAWTCWGYAAALAERGGQGDRVRAEGLLEEAFNISVELGMPPLRQRVETLKLETGDTRGNTYPAGLTQRESEVIRLIAGGRTDREIAEELIISVRTVTTHVGNILNKTGAANRAEAASYATRNGLAETTSGPGETD